MTMLSIGVAIWIAFATVAALSIGTLIVVADAYCIREWRKSGHDPLAGTAALFLTVSIGLITASGLVALGNTWLP